MNNELPPFAAQWIQQWKSAAPRLQAIRDEELRRMGDQSPRSISGHVLYDRYPERNGLVIMQRWFMRRQLLDLANQTRNV
jgi:hypothetical protein